MFLVVARLTRIKTFLGVQVIVKDQETLMLVHDMWSCDFVCICLLMLFILVYDFVMGLK